METIKNYLDNLFAGFPKTAEVENAKSELQNNMEDRYTELKAQGKSENEAIGIVISEFGNIDELMKELNVTPEKKNDDAVSVSREEAEEIISVKKRNGTWVGLGVFSILLGIAVMILVGCLIPGMENNRLDLGEPLTINSFLDVITLLPLFAGIAIGVAIFIISGTKTEKYKFLENRTISLSASTKAYVVSLRNRYQSTYTIMITLGVVLCILSPFLLICMLCIGGETDAASSLGVSIFLMFIAIAVFLFIRAGEEMGAYKQLLQVEDYTIESKKGNKKMEAVGAIYWPIVTVIYLAWSFITLSWHISWIVWPIAGVLYGAIAAIFNIVTGNTDSDR